jgi:hypothetical protein
MKRIVPLFILVMLLLCSCGVQQRQMANNSSEEKEYRKKASLGDYLKWIVLGILENERDAQQRRPNSGISINTPEPRFPPE